MTTERAGSPVHRVARRSSAARRPDLPTPSGYGSAVESEPEPASRQRPLARMHRAVFGLRARLLVWYVLLLLLAGILTLVVMRQVLLVRLEERVEGNLRQEIGELEALATGNDPGTGEPFGGDVEAILDTFLSRSIPDRHATFLAFVIGGEGQRSGAPDTYRLDLDADVLRRLSSIRAPERDFLDTPVGRVDYQAVTLEVDGRPRGIFVAAAFSDLARGEEVDTVVEITAIILGVTLLLVSMVAWGAAGLVVAPLITVTDTARSISETDLSRRIPETGAEEAAEMAATFNAMLDRLESGFDTQRRFIDDAGHELRTPITIIRGHLELLGDDPQERVEALALVDDELARMNRMVNDLLMLARSERPDFLNLEVVDVATLTRELYAKAERLASRRWELDLVGRGRIVADRQRLTEAVMQLAQNATQHTDERGCIRIGSRVADGTARFWVADDGDGVPDAERERVFGRFHRGVVGRRHSEGAGLGLAIVLAIAQAHGGTVELDSRSGQGATFTVTVPVDPSGEQPLPAQVSE